MKHNFFLAALLALLMVPAASFGGDTITISSLLNEMTSFDEATRRPVIPYTCRQVSSHDRRSISPDKAGWFANDDGFGVERVDTVDGRIEKVMFDCDGPGVITRIWLTTLDKRGTMRFYFDGSDEPGWIVPAYDLMAFGIGQLGRGMLLPHTSYQPDGKGGNTLFLPIPYARHCKITFEDQPGVAPTPKYYGINYRTYPADTKVETFSSDAVRRASMDIFKCDFALRNPVSPSGNKVRSKSAVLKSDGELSVSLPSGEHAVCCLRVNVDADTAHYAQAMRNIVVRATFDGVRTVDVPLSDFSGAGMGGFAVKSWFVDADGHGGVTSRWLMPYSRNARISLCNVGDFDIPVSVSASVCDYEWDDRSMYFHASWRSEDGVKLSNNYNSNDNLDWLFAHIAGDGVYKGDVMTLYNHSPRWYGEGDEKIWVDGETLPSHFGTGTEDYYNSSWAPVYIFHTPFGGAPRADEASSHGYNTFFRTRNLDGIPFRQDLRICFEMLSWEPGTVDIASTVFWYGDARSATTDFTSTKHAAKALIRP